MNMLALLRIFVVLLFAASTTCKRSSSAQKLLEKERQNSKCKSTSFNNIMNIRAKGSDKKLFGCLIKSLDSANGDGFMWSLLGEVFEKRGERSKANLCYKESIKLMGKVSKYIKKWHYIGPFTIGKNEIDGDPVQDWNGIQNVSQYRWAKNGGIYYSELAKGGEIKWMTINMNTASEPINIPSNTDWNELVLSLQSLGIAEWQGWIIGDFVVNEDSTILVQCLGASTMYINGTMITGDLYKRTEFWNPVYLKRGIHSVMIKLRSKAVLAVHLHLKQVQDKVPLSILRPPFLPDLVNGKLFSSHISLPVQNLHCCNWLKVLKVSLINKDTIFKVSLLEESGKFLIAPGQVKPLVIKIDYKNKHDSLINGDKSLCEDAELKLKVSFKGKDEKINLSLRCRKLSESFLFTFVDHDGSVQHGAAIAPLKGCQSGVCPVLLTLHGTTVPPQSQADSYKRMEKGEWVFGLDNLWVLAPTRHGAHNWEGPGKLTAMKALESLSLYTRESSFIELKADSDKMVVAGHSMGGHGAWIVGTHYPDQTLALVSAAGWIRKEDYGDSNLFFRHDVSTSHVSSEVKATMEACISENDADKHVSNLHGVPVMIRTGAADRTVHPYYSRRMYRLLRQQKSNVTYDEISGKEHWWWDTYKTNDGGVTNDPVIRGFAIKHAQHAGGAVSTNGDVCDKDKENCGENLANKYLQKQEAFGRNQAGDGMFILTVYNPASNNGVRGVRVIQQLVPFRQTSVHVELSSGTAVLRTENAGRITLREPEISPVHWHERRITVDDVDINVDSPLGKSSISLCTSENSWEVCEKEALESKLERGPRNMGPARRIAENPFLIVTGTGDPNVADILRQFAVYIANQFHLTSDAIAHMINDKDLDDSTADNYNLIVIGGPKHNSWSSKFHQNTPLKFHKDHLELGNCRYKAPRTGAMFLAPHADNRLALVLTGNSLLGVEDLVSFSTPTILPMARSPFSNMIPDFVVTGPGFGARGPGGYLCTGFWGNHWDYKRELSSCSC